MSISVRVQQEDFDLATELTALQQSCDGVGAVVNFVGLVRDFNQGDAVTALELTHYPAMTEAVLQQIVAEARQRWPLLAVTVIHRVGKLALNQQIVFRRLTD